MIIKQLGPISFSLDASRTERIFDSTYTYKKQIARDLFFNVTGQHASARQFPEPARRINGTIIGVPWPLCPKVVEFISWIGENDLELSGRIGIVLDLIEIATGFAPMPLPYKFWVGETDATLIKLTWC